MNNYNLKNINNNNIKNTDFNVDIDKKLFMDKILKFLRIYDLYNFYRNNLYNHPSFAIDGIDQNSDSLFTLNNIPNTLSDSRKFRSISENDFKYTIINHIMMQNAIIQINDNNSISQKIKIDNTVVLEDEIKKLSSQFKTDINNILSENQLFISIFDNSSFFVFITNDDYNLLLFIRNLIDYFLVTSKTDYKIHYDIIKSEAQQIFSKSISEENLEQLIYTINDGINMIPFIFESLLQKQYESKYLGISIILNILNFHLGLYYSFIQNNNLYDNRLENSKIFI